MFAMFSAHASLGDTLALAVATIGVVAVRVM